MSGESGRRLRDRDLVAREYATLDRLARRQLDVTGWLRLGEDDEWSVLQRAVAEVRPRESSMPGCGDGAVASTLAAPEVVCVDVSPAAVEAARARGLEARVADIQELPFADGEFDVVICNHVLYHLPDLDAGVRELARVLEADGRFAGIYNRRDHLAELWDASVTHGRRTTSGARTRRCSSATSHASNGARQTGEVLWESREALQGYLEAYSGLVGELHAPPQPYPFRARRRNCILVADRRPRFAMGRRRKACDG
jgi:SAM-dependent methyltransferase